VGFTALDATPVFPLYTNNNTNNGQLDFMTPHAVRAVANATVAEPCTRTGSIRTLPAHPIGAGTVFDMIHYTNLI
jgi:hypothetical protein